MSDAKPTGKLMTGAIGNFLLGLAALIFALTIGAAMVGAAPPSGTGAGIIGLVMFVFIIGGGICGGLGWFGLGSLYGGTNVLAGIFSIVVAIVPLLMIVLVMNSAESIARSGSLGGAEASANQMGTIGAILGLGVPAALGIFGGLGLMAAKSSLAKPAGIVMLLGGIGCAAMTAFAFIGVTNASLAAAAFYTGFIGLGVGFFLTGATMIGERSA